MAGEDKRAMRELFEQHYQIMEEGSKEWVVKDMEQFLKHIDEAANSIKEKKGLPEWRNRTMRGPTKLAD